MSAPEEIREIVHKAAQGLSDHPSEIRTEFVDTEEANTLCLVIRCHHNGPRDTDLGLIIGKKGRNIQALRTLIEAVGSKHKLRTTLIVKE